MTVLIFSTALFVLTAVYLRKKTFLLRVCGSSMHPTYKDGELLLISKTKHFKRGDAVVAKVVIKNTCQPIQVLKRVAWAGQTHVELHGDNLKCSIDSRDPSFGLIRNSDVIGKVLWKVS